MTQYIVHLGTGTILAAHECVTVELTDEMIDAMSGDDYFDEQLILSIAERKQAASS